MKHTLEPLLSLAGLRLSAPQWDQLSAYRNWLLREAMPAGGIGPHEAPRLTQRHIGESLAYGVVIPNDPSVITDYGSGVGLPGIPLAIAYPDCFVRMIDRSGRRVELVERALRILGLENASVERADLRDDKDRHQLIVTRAVFPPPDWGALVLPRLAHGGVAVNSTGAIGVIADLDAPAGGSLERVELPSEILDHSVRFLIMTRVDRTPPP